MLKRYLKGAFLICSLIGFVLLPVSVTSGQGALVGHTENKAQAQETELIIKMARATWDTGWFQAEIFKQLLESLGYTVDGPRTRDNAEFYEAVTTGEMDLWVNGWFPGHDLYIASARDKVEVVGFEVKGGALQGYMIDKRSADALSITSLADFTRPEVVSAFDSDGNGKANLIGCNNGWGCQDVIEHHLEAYGLGDTVEQIKGDYTPLMAETITQYKAGQAAFFYTWTPNWTIGALIPGQDVLWLEVPFPSLPADQSSFEEQSIIEGVIGCVANPCSLGFPPNDIRAVANKAFLEENPAVRSILEAVVIPLEDISAQNGLIFAGEDDNEDIRRHAKVWIENNQAFVERWLEDARAAHAASGLPDLVPTVTNDVSVNVPTADKPVLRVATKTFEPFVIYDLQSGQYTGFSIDLWDKLAREIGVEYELYGVNSIAKLLDEVERGAADIAAAGIGMTSQREKYLNFSHSYFQSGLQIMVTQKDRGLWGDSLLALFSALFSRQLLEALAFLLLTLLISAHIIWYFERDHNPQFPKQYFRGIWESFWWSAVTVTTVGYGDKTPKGIVGRLFGLVWMFAGLFILAYFTAGIATTFTLQEMQGQITGPQDLIGKQVGTVKRSAAAEYLVRQGIRPKTYEIEAELYKALLAGDVDAIVYDAPVLQHYASNQGQGQVKLAGFIFQEQNYGVALPVHSPYREQINLALLQLIERGEYQELYHKWFGAEQGGEQ